MKEQIDFQNVVAETLLIPLYMRSKESRRPKGNCIMHDPLAESLVERIDYDYSLFDNAGMSELGCVIRGRHFDQKVQDFILRYNSPVVVNIGCGLDTRFQRTEHKGNAIFYELDLPEVIEVRKKLIPEPERDIYISGSVLEHDWMDNLKKQYPESRFIFIIEGVLMYFYEKQVKSLLFNLATRFPGGEIHFDVCGPMMINTGLKPDSLRKHEAEIRWGIAHGKEIERWLPQLAMTDRVSYMDIEKKRWGMKGVIGRMVPGLAYKFSSILGYKIKGLL